MSNINVRRGLTIVMTALKSKRNSIPFVISLCVLLIASFIAQMISTQGGKIKVESIQIDSRGAMLSADLYYPGGTNDTDSLPAILVAHGAGVTKGNMRGIAEELARRGFVVLNVNGYATGYSELPAYDERDMGVEGYDTWTTPSGMYDALNFVRTLNFVDQERIGIIGHSQGSRRAEYTTLLDNGCLTLNDIMVNVLYDTFGQTFTEDEITLNADDLAAERLSAEELELYNYIKEEKTQWFNTRVHSLLLVGSSATNTGHLMPVTVAGHEVMRNVQMNMGLINGIYDSTEYARADTTLESFYLPDDVTSLTTDKWYMVDDLTGTSTIIGDFYGSVLENEELQNALDNHMVRLVSFNVETHSKEFFSSDTAQDIVKYFEQTLLYNGGELGASDASPVDASSIIFFAREAFNFIAMLAMFAMLVSLAGIFLQTKFFSSCVGTAEASAVKLSRPRYWIVAAITIIFGFIAIYRVNNIFAPGLPNTSFFPLFPSWWLTLIFLCALAVFSIVELIVFFRLDKKKYGSDFVSGLNVKLGVANVLKTLLLAIILFVCAYLSLSVIKYLFGQDYRLWMFAFEELKADQWVDILKYGIILFPELLLIGAAINYAPRRDLPGWLDDLLAVVTNSLGIWLCCIINTIIIYSGNPQLCNFTSSYGFLLSVPIVAYLLRRMYKKSHSIWLGAAIAAFILAWTMSTTIGYNIYFPQSAFMNFLFA